MVKKKGSAWLILIPIVLLAGGLFALWYTGYLKIPQSIFTGGVERTSLSGVFHQQIDPYFPNFIHTAEVACVAINGQWFDQADKVGCFDMPSGSFDSTNCQMPQYQAIANVCNGIQGTDWTCTVNSAGCWYV